MPEPEFDMLGIGNAIVDVIARTEEDFLVRENLIKGSMRLIDTEEAERLYALMGAAIEASGGCAGNTAAGVGSFGGRAAFIGQVADDQLGAIYRHDMHALGIHFETLPLRESDPTARSMILITPDGERTMNTYLGACHQLTEADIREDEIGAATITYMEGFLWDPVEAKKAFVRAANYAHRHERASAFTLSDPFCVNRYREEFLPTAKPCLRVAHGQVDHRHRALSAGTAHQRAATTNDAHGLIEVEHARQMRRCDLAHAMPDKGVRFDTK